MVEPGCVFIDTVNRDNPLPGLGDIQACNPCGEQFLHDGDICNLGSLNLEKFVKNQEINYEELARVTKLAVHMLDNVIDMCEFPVKRVQDACRNNRRIGLGVMGFADMLYLLGVPYDSEDARKIAEEVMAVIQSSAFTKNSTLASHKGSFPNLGRSSFTTSIRNCSLTNVPPTGTISMMFDVSGGIEPYFALYFIKKNILGGKEMIYINRHLERMLRNLTLYTANT